MMTTTRRRRTMITSFRAVAFHAMSSVNGWSLGERLHATSRRRQGCRAVRQRALAVIGGSSHGVGDVGRADWRTTMALGDVRGSRVGRRSLTGGRAGGNKMRRRPRSAEAAVADVVGFFFSSAKCDYVLYSMFLAYAMLGRSI